MNKIFLSLIFMIVSTFLLAQSQIMNYSFLYPNQTVDGSGYSDFQFDNCLSIGEADVPAVSYFTSSLLLRPGEEIQEIIVREVEFYPTLNNIILKPRSENFPISKGMPEGYAPNFDPSVYAANAEYPAQIIDNNTIITSFMRGHAVGSFLLCPIRYNPVAQTVRFIKNITIEVVTHSTVRAEEALQLLRNDENTKKQLERLIGKDCTSSLAQYQSVQTRIASSNYDILIVTAAEFADAMNEYIAHKNLMGYKVALETTENISAQYSGVDDADKVRNCIKEYYINEGISYVFLVGDSHTSNPSLSKIPLRHFYSTLQNSSVSDRYIAADMYFSCLDGNWNSNGNDKFGEPTDDCDLMHEVAVGRLCADNVSEINTFVNKLKLYETAPVVSDIKKILLVGEQLDTYTYGGNAKDIVANGGNLNGVPMAPIPSSFTISKLYERDGYWNKGNLFSQWNNNGTHLVNHLGHCNVDYNMKLYNSDVTASNIQNNGINRGFFIVYSQGCYNGSFDNRNENGGSTSYDCINEMHLKLNTGAIANIGNTRYGWYNTNNAGPSQMLDRTFFNAIFGKGMYHVGNVHSDSKDVLANYISSDLYLRWCAYELTLQGDPTMDIWTDTPTDFSPVYPNALSITDTEVEVNTGEPFARVALLQGSELIGRAVSDENGIAIVAVNNINPVIQDILISITGHNKMRFEGSIKLAEGSSVLDLAAGVNSIEVSLTWTVPNRMPQEYKILRNDVLIATIPSSVTNYIDRADKENTTFRYCVIAVYEDYELPACIEVTTGNACSIIDKLEYSISSATVQLTWTLTDLSFPPDQIVITRNDVLLGVITDITNTYIDDNAEEGKDYNYCVIMEHGSCETESACIEVKLTNLNENNAEVIEVFPNPTNNKINVTGRSIQKIELYNVIGQLVQTHNINGQSTVSVPVENLHNGIYFLKIINVNKEIVRRFVIQK